MNKSLLLLCLSVFVFALSLSTGRNTGIPCTKQGLFQHNNKSCDAYYVCHRGYWHEGFCPEPFWFHEKEQICDHNWNVNCSIGIYTTEEIETSTTTEFTTPDIPKPSNAPTTTTEPPEIDLNDYCAEGVLGALPHPFNCNRFILCFDGVAVERFCGEDMHFGAREKTCMLIEEANCALDGTACPKVNDPENIKTIPNEYDCRGFYICFSQSPIPAYCGRGAHWNQERQTCILEGRSNCTSLPPPYPGYKNDEALCPSDNSTHLLPHPREKGKFFLCDNGFPHLLDYSVKTQNLVNFQVYN